MSAETAIHESSHACVAVLYSIKFDSVTCRPNYQKDWLGCISGLSPYHSPAYVFEEIEVGERIMNLPTKERIPLTYSQIRDNHKHIKMCLAAAAAEIRFFGNYKNGCEDDFGTAEGIIWYNSFMKKSEAQCVKDRFKMLKWTLRLFEDRWLAPTPLWEKCFRLSDALYHAKNKTMTYKEAKAVYDAN